MNYSISIDHSSKIIRYKHSGELGYADIGAAWGELLSLKEFTQERYNLLSDYRGATFKIKVKQIEDIVAFLKNIGPVVQGKKQSIIIEDPYSTAGTFLFRDKVFDEIGFRVQVFSTEEEAVWWLSY